MSSLQCPHLLTSNLSLFQVVQLPKMGLSMNIIEPVCIQMPLNPPAIPNLNPSPSTHPNHPHLDRSMGDSNSPHFTPPRQTSKRNIRRRNFGYESDQLLNLWSKKDVSKCPPKEKQLPLVACNTKSNAVEFLGINISLSFIEMLNSLLKSMNKSYTAVTWQIFIVNNHYLVQKNFNILSNRNVFRLEFPSTITFSALINKKNMNICVWLNITGVAAFKWTLSTEMF